MQGAGVVVLQVWALAAWAQSAPPPSPAEIYVCTDDQGRLQHRFEGQQRVQGQCGGCLGSVDEGEAFLRAQHQGRYAGPRQGIARRHFLPVLQHAALAHQRQRHVGQRRQIARPGIML